MNNFIFASITMLLASAVQAQPPISCIKIGYADMPYIFSKMPAARQVEAELKSLETQLKNQLEFKHVELQRKSEEFKKNGPTMVEPVRQNTLRELELLNNNLAKFQEEAEATLQRKHAQLMEPLYKSLGKAIEEVAKENDFAYILNPGMSDADMILYADTKYNVSDLVLKKMLSVATSKPVPE
jgi:outer membrane protein